MRTAGRRIVQTQFVRLLRTSSSERFALRRRDEDMAVLDLHYLGDRTVQATLILFEDAGVSTEQAPALLTEIDEVLLPEARLDNHTLIFTVVSGRVLGAFTANAQDKPAANA
jgi:hypothetical protein